MSVDDDALPIESLRDIDRACLAFEQAWRTGGHPRIEQYLGDATGIERAALLQQLLLLELDYRHDEACEQEFAERFPDDQPTISVVFAQVQREASHPTEAAALSADEDARFSQPRYQVLRHLAKGGLGDVFVARDRQLNREVALKELQEARGCQAAARLRFLTEAEVTGVLEHPGIAPVHSLERHSDGRLFYTMRLVHGTTLKEAIAAYHAADLSPGAQTLQFRKLLGHFIDVCETIDYAHHQGILHRDLKPANVMLGRYGETVVVDWGLAKNMDASDPLADASHDGGTHPAVDTDSRTASTQTGAVMGTPAFMSPEQARGAADDLGPRSDIYSLGATLYVVLTGRSPYQDEQPSAALAKVRTGVCQPAHAANSKVPRALSAICGKAMAFQPKDRYPSARALANDIEAWLADEPVAAYRDHRIARATRWARRHPTTVGMILVGVVVALIGFAIGMTAVQHKNRQLHTANRRAVAATQQAQRHFQLALNAIEGYYGGVSEDLLLRGPESTALRQRLLQFPLHFYEQLGWELEQSGRDDPASRARLANAYYAIATITFYIGSPHDALDACQHSAEILERLHRQFPRALEYRGALSATYNRLGIIRQSLGKLDDAQRDYDRAVALVKDQPPNAGAAYEQRAQLARTYNNLALLEQQRGNLVKARGYLERAIAVNRTLLQQTPATRIVQNDLAKCEGNLGLLLANLGHADAARTHHTAAIELDRALLAAEPTNVDYVGNAAAHWYNLAALQFMHEHNPSTSQQTLKHALAHDAWLVGRFPNVDSFRSDYLLHLNFAGTIARQLSDGQSAIDYFERAIAVGTQLVNDSQAADSGSLTTPDHRDNVATKQRGDAIPTAANASGPRRGRPCDAALLGGVHCNLGQLQMDAKSMQTALSHFDQAIALLFRVVATSPHDVTARQFLRNSHWSRATALDALGKHARAAADWKRTLELSETKSASYRIRYAQALARSGDHRDAAAQVRDLDLKTVAARLRYETARVFALAANATNTDDSLSTQQQVTLARQYADDAIALLRAEAKQGYLASAPHRTVLKNDPDFVPLQAHADWQLLITPE